MFHFYILWKCKKSINFLRISGNIEMEHWREMSYNFTFDQATKDKVLHYFRKKSQTQLFDEVLNTRLYKFAILSKIYWNRISFSIRIPT